MIWVTNCFLSWCRQTYKIFLFFRNKLERLWDVIWGAVSVACCKNNHLVIQSSWVRTLPLLPPAEISKKSLVQLIKIFIPVLSFPCKKFRVNLIKKDVDLLALGWHSPNVFKHFTIIGVNQPPVSATRWQRVPQICFETFILWKISKLLITYQPQKVKKNRYRFGILIFRNILKYFYQNLTN